MNYQSMKSACKRWAELASNFALAMDASPSELLHDEICSLRRELAELRRQFDENSSRTDLQIDCGPG